MSKGYVKLHRKILDSGVMQHPKTYTLFSFLLLKATHKAIRYSGIDLERGQYVSGRIELAEKLNQTQQEVRTSLKRLQKWEMLTIKSTNKYSVYTIVNYDIYQASDSDVNQQDNQQVTNKQPASNQQVTTKQEHKNIKTKEKNIAPLAMLVAMNVPESLAKDWLAVRKAKKKEPTQTAFTTIKNHAEKHGYTFAEAVEIATSEGWAGFKHEWVLNLDGNKTKPTKSNSLDDWANEDLPENVKVINA